MFDSGARPHLLSSECDRRDLLITVIVRCVDNATCCMTPK